ncbi:LysM peptidoglycan-binding domain-containing protein [uncultured Hymenobacter sp.]|uniref:LysM peptidoglycan-binding domain-containing protein n=1 Tax=uncultured Hymenobacter sp. TaxID=170016 RepID=UPI0035CA43B7
MKHWHLPSRAFSRRLRRALPALLAPFALPALAQQVPAGGDIRNPNVIREDTIRQVQLLLPDSLTAVPVAPEVDSVRLVWLRTPPTQRDLIGDRMSCFETAVPHQFNNAVLAYVNLFTQRQRGYTQRVLEREQFYFPIFEKYLAQYNLPTDLKYLAVVESALIPTAKSPVGATGLWQFMGPTAGDLRLKKDEWVDERMHPEKATEAACKHLKYLYGMFHDWELVLAAYNWGGGSMKRVMRRTGKTTFWDLYPHLPAETRNYVPTFTAIMYTMKYAEQHQLRAPELRYQVAEALDTLTINGQPIDLRRLSRALGYADSMALQRFNPELRRGALPAGYRSYVLRYPSAARPNLGDADRATLLEYCRPAAELPLALAPLPPRIEGVEPFPTRDLLAAASGPRARTEEARPRSRRVRHMVRRGETVARLAERFEVSPAQLRRWNELKKGQALRPGRQLVVFMPLPPALPATEVIAAAPAVAPTPIVLPTVRPVVDEATQRLAAANARYTREAAEAAAREKAQAQQLARLQKAEAARLAARATAERQHLAIARTVAAAQTVAEAKAARQKQREAEAITAVEDSTQETSTEETLAVATSAPESAPAAASQPAVRKQSISLPPPAKASPPEEIVAARLYIVRRGDNLTRLAHERGLSVAQVVAWNNLKSGSVEAGQRLVFVAPAAENTAPARGARSHPTVSRMNAAKADLETRFHQVQPGDTLYNISRRFGISVQQLRKLNRLTSDEVKLGQKLVVQAG